MLWNMFVCLATLLVGLAILVKLVQKVRELCRVRRHVACIPGPPTLPVLGNALYFLGNTHDILQTLLCLVESWGGTVRVWYGTRLAVYLSEPEDLEVLFTSQACLDKDDIYDFFKPVLGEGLLTAGGEQWKRNRKMINKTFHVSVLKHFLRVFQHNSEILVQKLEGKVEGTEGVEEKEGIEGKAFDIFPYIRNCSIDFILETAMELNLQAQDNSVTKEVEAAEKLMNIMYQRLFKVWLYPDFLFKRTSLGREQDSCVQCIRRFIEDVIEKQKAGWEGRGEGQTFLRLLLEGNEGKEEGGGFSDEQLRDEMITMIITGYETTAATVSFLLMMLGIHPAVQQRLQEEVRVVLEGLEGREGRELETQDLARLQYMEMVIKETLRLFPVAPVIGRTVNADVHFKNFTIPKGVVVGAVISRTHRDPQVWSEPDRFNPDNFLPENCAKRHSYSYVPFSAGSRACIGQKYAMMSMKVMLCHLLHRFTFVCDTRLQDIRLKSEVTMKAVGGFNVRIRRRMNTA